MMSNNLYIIPTNIYYKSSFDLLEKILHTNNSVFFYIYQDPNRSDLYYKYFSILKKNFAKHIANKKLYIDRYQNQDLNVISTIPMHNFFNNYNRYIFLNPKNLYISTFFDIDYHKYDLVGIKPYTNVELNFRINSNTDSYLWSLSKQAVQYCIAKHIKLENLYKIQNTDPLTKYIIKSDKMLSFDHVNHINNKYTIWEDKFKLIYLVETDKKLKDSYCFLYTDNSKCMNIENNIVGQFTIENNEKIIIKWDNGLSTYIKTENDNYYALKESVEDL